LFKPVTKFMADRAQRVRAVIEQADKARADSQKLLAEYEGRLKSAEAVADEIIKKARKDAETESRQIIAEGKAAAEALTTAARRQIESERQAAFAHFKVEAASLVMAACARLIQREISGDDNRRYAAMLLDELERKGNS
jgi:F-type H+-transporting ATPase subunit b